MKHWWNNLTDQMLDNFIGNLLRVGVLSAAGIVFVGGVFYLISYGTARPELAKFVSEPNTLRHIPTIVQEAFAGHSRGLIQLGLLVLIATPVARVAFSAVAFGIQKDRLYVVVTLIVLSVLLGSLIWG